MAFKVEQSISWGDLGMGVGLLITGIVAFTDLGERVAVQDEKITTTAAYVKVIDINLETHKRDSLAADQAIKAEIRTELRDINQKLDRIVERGSIK